MPNWCSNEVTITYNKETRNSNTFIQELEKYIDENGGSFFQYLRPMPEYMARIDDTWYDWRTQNWGCKWDACETHIVYSNYLMNTITLQFETPWAPPVELYNFLSELGFKVSATFSEPMMNFKGTYELGEYYEEEYETINEED